MATKVLSRKHKALAMVPLALVSGVWTASLATGSTAVAADKVNTDSLPDGTDVPTQAIESPANLPSAGVIASGVPSGTADQVVNGATTGGIPSAALSAYQRAAQIIDSADKTCNIPWELIGAIGRVESDHGRFNGNVLSANGVSQPGVYGIGLDGKNGTQAVRDTDGGSIDKDTRWDRAVGPMQFIPSTWQVVKVDADGDGKRNPQDIDDASLATAVYLCSGSGDLGTSAGQKKAVYRYNHSQAYVDLVLRLMKAYMSGDYTAVPNDASGGQTLSYSDSSSFSPIRKQAKAKQQRQRAAASAATGGGANGSGATGGSGSTGGTGSSTGSGTGSSTSGSGANGTNGTLPGAGTPGGSGGGLAGGVAKSLDDTVKGVLGGGGSSNGGSGNGGSGNGGGSTPAPAPAPVKDVLTKTQARVKCLAQGISVLDVAKLAKCIADLTGG